MLIWPRPLVREFWDIFIYKFSFTNLENLEIFVTNIKISFTFSFPDRDFWGLFSLFSLCSGYPEPVVLG